MSEMNSLGEAPRRGMPLWIQLIVWVGLIALLAVLALGLKNAQQGSVQAGESTPDFTLKFFDGYSYRDRNEVSLSDLSGKVVVVNFWASWCEPCKQEAAALEATWKSYEPDGNVVFLGVDYIDTPTEALGYLREFNISYPNGPDLETRVSQLFRIKGVPETYFIDQSGKLVYTQVGPFESEAQIHAIIDSLVNK
jgi:cytochrome c biogenesis protein CcmG, thiol:disulfide interchange protein DsbE